MNESIQRQDAHCPLCFPKYDYRIFLNKDSQCFPAEIDKESELLRT